MAPQNGFPNGPTSRVAVESEPTRDEAPSCLPRRIGHPGCLARAPFRLSRFPTQFLQGLHPTRPGREGEPRGTRLAKRPRSLKPAAGHPENRTKGRRVRCPPHQRDVCLGLASPKSPWSLAFTVTDKQSKGRWGSAHPTSETCFWAWRRSKKPLELSCDRYREPDQGALG
ncbi:hypothetical protein G5714_024565 [Onychostoma macrolepis]|uniref:Uncharacterized protein n=1 Tax=Onychostoma macrolepis TaxID=369639 RepID=A0A7J6BIE2_9TELE|nr:hypothetical protein G5714_024565 [Onychostoma macrolepis]